MATSTSYLDVVPARVLDRYDFAETRKAALVLAATNPDAWKALLDVLDAFCVDPATDISPPGGHESEPAARLNDLLSGHGFVEAAYRITVTSELIDAKKQVIPSTQSTTSYTTYLIDNVGGRVVIDVEWHAKDGNLGRDLLAYRSLYELERIDAAVIITMTQRDMRAWARVLDPKSTKFATATTTNLEKLRPMLDRGDPGGCPVLVASVCRRTGCS